MTYANIGSISSGTLRTEDLLEACSYALEHLAGLNDDLDMQVTHLGYVAEARSLLELGCDNWDEDQDDEARELLNEDLFQALDLYSPPFCHFGAYEGDGSDFGFWISFDSLEEAARHRDGVVKIDAGDPWPLDYESAAASAGYAVRRTGGRLDPEFAWVRAELLDSYGEPAWGSELDNDFDLDAVLREDETFDTEAEAWRDCCETLNLAPGFGEPVDYVMEVTDHGNISLFNAHDHNEIWGCV